MPAGPSVREIDKPVGNGHLALTGRGPRRLIVAFAGADLLLAANPSKSEELV